MSWLIKAGDILEETADVLVCSANPWLTMSGGVGGAFLLRYGDAVQRELQQFLADNRRSCVQQGEIVVTSGGGSSFQFILHAVGVDAFYDCSALVLTDLLARCLELCAERQALTVALTAVGTGYGRLEWPEFARGLHPVLHRKFPPVEQVTLFVRHESDREELLELLPILSRGDE